MKDYDRWNDEKKEIEKRLHIPLFGEREIWWCSLGVNLGHETDGTSEDFERPVCVLRKFNKDTFLGLPLSSTVKSSKYYHPLAQHGIGGAINLSQGRLLSAKRLRRRLGRMSNEEFELLKNELRDLLF